jgi:NAD+ synthase
MSNKFDPITPIFVMPNLEDRLVKFIQDYVHKSGFENVVIGVSGGLDSAVVATLCVKALGAEHVHGLLLPYGLSISDNFVDSENLCKHLKISYDVVNITPLIDMYFDRFPTSNKVQFGNKCARERMAILYDFSVRHNALVAGTSNKSEMMIGYFTQYGDGAAAFEPIGDLYKTEVFELAKQLGVPEAIINKKPTADLWPGQTDEGEIGLSYADLDIILFSLEKMANDNMAIGYMEAQIATLEGFVQDARITRDGLTIINTKSQIKEMKKEIEKAKLEMNEIYEHYSKATVEMVEKKIKNSQFKRELPPIAKVR